jgi:hypothetical protein
MSKGDKPAPSSDLPEMRRRLGSNQLTDDDRRFIDLLLAQAERQGLGEKVGDRRVVARLPNGMTSSSRYRPHPQPLGFGDHGV